MAFYKKYRPKSLNEMVGNTTTVKALTAMLQKKTRPSAFLFTGISGGGKTTFGRILRSEFKCHPDDYTEINSSDFRGIDMVRDLRERCKYSPLHGDVKMYLIDECHQLTKIAQDAMLKLLEDTPSHVIFVLCTTDPQMLKVAVKNRCQSYVVQPLSNTDIDGLLSSIIKKEKIKINKKALKQLVANSDGSAREAIQQLEKMSNVDGDEQLEIAKEAKVIEKATIDLCRILMKPGKSSWKSIATILTGLKGQDPEGIRRAVLGYVTNTLLNGAGNQRAGLILETFDVPTYNSGFPSLVLMAYTVYISS